MSRKLKIMKFNIIRCSILILLIGLSCKKQETNLKVEELFRIEADPKTKFWFRDGVVYDNLYLVWSKDENENKKLEAFDINDKIKVWEFDFNGIYGWGNEMNIYKDILVTDKIDLGISIFNLKEQKIVVNYRYDMVPNFSSTTPVSLFENKVYKAIEQSYLGLSTIISFNIIDGSVKNEFQWLLDPNKKVSLATPLIFNNQETGSIDFIMLLQLRNSNSEPLISSETYLISVQENYKLNWKDTIKLQDKISFLQFLPQIVENDVVVGFEEYLISYDLKTGKRNWTSDLLGKSSPKLTSVDSKLYINYGLGLGFGRYDIKENVQKWNQNNARTPSFFGDFEIINNKIVYVSDNFGDLIILDDNSGEVLKYDKTIISSIANPKYDITNQFFVTHNENEIITFTIKD